MRTLDPKKHEELLRKKRDVATVKRGLRELYDSYPDAFELVARQMMLGNWRELLPPIVKGRDGKVIKVTEESLLLLLVDYRSRPKGMSRSQFVKIMRMDVGGDYFQNTWRGETLLHYLNKAERLAKQSRSFAHFVDIALRRRGVKAP